MPASTRRPAPGGPRRKPRPIALASLRGFEAAARHLSFTLAAQELNLTQSSISRQVATIERQLGRALFVRRTRALELTAAGERLFASVRQAILSVDRTVDDIRGSGGPPRITVATYASFASLWLVPRLAAFQALHPEIEFRIDAADRYVDLEADEIDVALRWTRGMPDSDDSILLCEDESSPALSTRLIESSGVELRTPADLGALALLELDDSLPDPPNTRFARWFAHAGAAPARASGRIRFTYIDQAVQAAVRGQGVTLVHRPFLDDLLASGELVEPFPALRMRTGYRYLMIVNPRRAKLPHVEAFRDWVVGQFAANRGLRES